MTIRAGDYMLSRPWAMERSRLEEMLSIANREGPGPEAVAAQLGRPLENTRSVELRDGVAIVPVVGPLFRRANLLTEVSGATSVGALAQDLDKALADPAVTSILLNVDSPGGEANGIGEVAGMLAAARQKKPVHCYVGGMAASGGYWLAAACETITMDRSAQVGSIGVVWGFRKGGGEVVEFVSSQSPNKRPNLETEEGRAEVQRTVDEMASVFIEDVAKFRSVDARTVEEEFGRGGLKVGRSAVRAGMADRLGTFEGLVAMLKKGRMPKRKEMSASADVEEEISGDVLPGGTADLPASEDEEHMSSELETMKADLAAEKARVTQAEAERDTARAALNALEQRVNTAEQAAAEAKALATIGAAALNDLRAEYQAGALKLGRNETEVTLIGQMLVDAKNYDGLKGLVKDTRTAVFGKFPASPTANVDDAGKEPSGENLTAADQMIINAEAKRTGKPVPECTAAFIAARKARQARIVTAH